MCFVFVTKFVKCCTTFFVVAHARSPKELILLVMCCVFFKRRWFFHCILGHHYCVLSASAQSARHALLGYFLEICCLENLNLILSGSAFFASNDKEY